MAPSGRLYGVDNRAASGRGSGTRYPEVAATASLPARPLRRQPYPHEVRAAVDFAGLDAIYDETADRIEALWEREWLLEARVALRDAIEYTKRGTDRVRVTRADMARIRLAPFNSEALTDLLMDAAIAGARSASEELMVQDVAALAPTEAQLRARVADHAQAVAQQTADGISLAASRRAVQVAQGRDAFEVADEVDVYVGDLAHRWERDQLIGAVQQATNAGRFAVFERIPAEAPAGFYASELLDSATCDRCLEVDGREYVTLAEAIRDYPSGGFMGCRGGPRCRGTVVAVLPEAAFALESSPSLLGPAPL